MINKKLSKLLNILVESADGYYQRAFESEIRIMQNIKS